jgi:hypothetical protein
MILESMYTEDDLKVVPEEMQKMIRSVFLEKIQPAILDMPKFENFKHWGIAVERVSYEDFYGSWKPGFEKEQQYDLYLMEQYSCLPEEVYFKVAAKKFVGAAIRISEWIGKKEYADELKGIVQDFLTPEEQPDPTDLLPPFLQ